MQGLDNPNREVLDAEALGRQLVDEGSVYAFWLITAPPCSMTTRLGICFRQEGTAGRYRNMTDA